MINSRKCASCFAENGLFVRGLVAFDFAAACVTVRLFAFPTVVFRAADVGRAVAFLVLAAGFLEVLAAVFLVDFFAGAFAVLGVALLVVFFLVDFVVVFLARFFVATFFGADFPRFAVAFLVVFALAFVDFAAVLRADFFAADFTRFGVACLAVFAFGFVDLFATVFLAVAFTFADLATGLAATFFAFDFAWLPAALADLPPAVFDDFEAEADLLTARLPEAADFFDRDAEALFGVLEPLFFDFAFCVAIVKTCSLNRQLDEHRS